MTSPMQMFVLGSVAVLLGLASDAVWATTASRLRDWFNASPRRGRALGTVGGVSMIGLGVGIALTGRPGVGSRRRQAGRQLVRRRALAHLFGRLAAGRRCRRAAAGRTPSTSWIASAMVRSVSSSDRRSAMSMPLETPAAVMIRDSGTSTTRCGVGLAPRQPQGLEMNEVAGGRDPGQQAGGREDQRPRADRRRPRRRRMDPRDPLRQRTGERAARSPDHPAPRRRRGR